MPGRLRVDRSFRLEGQRGVVSRTPVVHGGRVFQVFVHDRGDWLQSRLLCFDAGTLELQWEHVEDDALLNAMISRDGRLLCARMTGTATVLAFDPLTGDRAWTWTGDDEGTGVLSEDVGGRVVLAGVGDAGTSWCLDSATGEALWSFGNGDQPHSTAASEGRLFLTTERRLNALDAATGSLLWTRTEEASYLFQPAVVGGVVVVGGHGLLDFHDPADGALLARVSTGRPRAAIYAIAVRGNTLWFGDSQGHVCCYEVTVSDGVSAVQRWTHTCAGAAVGMPAVVGDRVYVTDDARKLTALDAASGEPLAQVGIRGRARSTGVTADGSALFVAAERNLLRIVGS